MLIGPSRLQILVSAAEAIGSSLYDVITNQFGTHVARKLLVVAAGHNVAPQRGAFSGSDQSMRNTTVRFLSPYKLPDHHL